MTNRSFAGVTRPAPVRTPSHIIVAQSTLAGLQVHARFLERFRTQCGSPVAHERIEVALERLYDRIEGLDQQIAAYWHDRAWGSR